jgi:flagellar hook-basal body complex protein FliE
MNESVNANIHAGFESFSNQLDIKFEKINQRQIELSDNMQRFESDMVDLRKALIHDDTRLSNLDACIASISEQQALLQSQQKEEEKRGVYLLNESKRQQEASEQLQNGLKKADSFSNFLKMRCDDVQDSVKQVSQSVEKQATRLDEECVQIKRRFCNYDRQNQQMNSHLSNFTKLAEHNQGEINKHSRRFGEVDVRIEQLSEQIRDIRVVEEVTQVVPAAEEWHNRRRREVESDTEQHMGGFHGKMKRHKSTVCSRLSAWNGNGSDDESRGSLDGVQNRGCAKDKPAVEGNRSQRVNFERRCLSEEKLGSTHSLNDSENVNDKNPTHETNLVAQLITQLTQRKNAISLPPFDGVNADLNSYKRQCMAIAKQNGWTSQELAVQIISSLQGDARTLMTLLPQGEENNLESVWKILNSRFDRTVSAEMAKNQLNTLQQKKGESFLHLQLEVERLMNRAYPLANEEMLNQLALDQFIKSINSSGVRYEVRLRSPKDLSQARHLAEEISMIQNSEKYQRLTYVNQITLTDEAMASDTTDDEQEVKNRRRKRKKVTHADSREQEQVIRRNNGDQPRPQNFLGRQWHRGNAVQQRGNPRQNYQYAPRGHPGNRRDYSSLRDAVSGGGLRPQREQREYHEDRSNGHSGLRYDQREFGGNWDNRHSEFQRDQPRFSGDRKDGEGYCDARSGDWDGNRNQRGRENFNRGRGSQDQRWAHRQRLRDLMEVDQSRSPVKGVRRQ